MIKIRHALFLVGSILIFTHNMAAQSKLTVSGVVKDVSGVPVPGASILVKGTTIGTQTDFDGHYELSGIAENSILVYSYLGMKTQEIRVGNRTIIDVVMEEFATALDQVVVVGYGSVRKKDLTGAVSSISSDALDENPVSSADQALQGRVSGIVATRSSGQPGGSVSVRVRGITSLTGTNEPLYIIDGVRVTSAGNDSFNFSIIGGGGGQTRVSPLSNLNPSDIESIDILKDASAAAIYGASAANGVILITTKRGKAGRAKLNYETYWGLQMVPSYIDVMNLQQYARYITDVYASFGQPAPFKFRNPDILGDGTDWQREIFRTAPISQHQLSISGGKDNTRFYASANYFNQEGIVINSDFRRYGLRLNLDHKFNDWIQIGNNINISNSREHVTSNDNESGVISAALRQSPEIPVRFSDGSFGGPDPSEGLGVGNGRNPVAWSEIRNAQLDRYKINGNFFLQFSILDGLTFKSDIGYDYNTSKSRSFNPTYEIGSEVNEVSQAYLNMGESFYWLFKNYLTYNKKFGNHAITLLVGQEAQQSKFEGLGGSRRSFVDNNITALDAGDPLTATNFNYKGTWSMSSYFSRLNYAYNDTYLLSLSVRADGSSRFGNNNKYGYFPAFSAAWVLSEESFMEGIKETLSWAKIRYGYGSIGNQEINDYAYGAALRSEATVFGNGFLQRNIANPDVRWESLVSNNIGLELGFLNNRIRLEADVYEKVSKDFLFVQPLPSFLGAHNTASYLGVNPPTVNLGEMKNTGVDLTLKTHNITKADFDWSTTVVFSSYKNELVSLADDNDVIFRTFEFNNTLTKTAVGEPVGQFFGYITDGLFRTEEELNNGPIPDGNPIDPINGTWLGDIRFKDLNGDGIINSDDRAFIGSPHPDFTYSVTNNFRYKNFDLSIYLQGSQGSEIYNWSRRLTEGMRETAGNQGAVIADRYTAENTDTNIPRFVNGDPNNNSRVSNRFIEDGSYLRIQNVTFGYNIPTRLFGSKPFFDKLRVYAIAQNLYTFTKYSGYDPEIGGYNQDALLSSVDNGRYPVPRTITLGLNAQF